MPSPPTSPTMSPRPASASSRHARDTPQREDSKMQIFVRCSTGETTTLTVPPSTSIAMVKSLIAVQHPKALPSASMRLTFAGRSLDLPENTLSDLDIPAASTLDFALPPRSATPDDGSSEPSVSAIEPAAVAAASSPSPSSSPDAPAAATPAAAPLPAAAPAAKPAVRPAGTPKRKGPRCHLAGCNQAAQRIVGECGFCGGNFCGKHRLLESHACDGLDAAKKADKDRNKAKLESERTIMSRGLGV